MRPLAEQTVLVTGSTAGLGLETARRLFEAGAEVLVHGRNDERVEHALAEVGGDGTGERLRGFVADLSSLEETRRLARRVAGAVDRLDLLVNNAGLAPADGLRHLSREGHELTLAVNHLAHFLLTLELLDLLRASAPARIVNVASAAQAPIDFDDVMLERGYDDYRAYAQSKLAQVEFTLELQERLRAAGEHRVEVAALHPATLMDTRMVRDSFGPPLTSVSAGVEAVLHVATEAEEVGGRYFDGMRESAAHPQAYEGAARQRLWDLSEQLTATSSGASLGGRNL